MSLQIGPSSCDLSKVVELPRTREGKYPFDRLEVGESFTAQIVDTNEKSLRACVIARNKKGVKKFVFVRHDDLGLLEVGRIL